MKTNKRGISLIVLVITIVVMIILAATIILSLNSSNISGKASEAKLSSDLANKKEAASVYLSEYEIKVAKGKIDSNVTTADKYVKAQLKKAGLDTSDIAVTEEGDILVGIAAMFVNNEVKIGTDVEGYNLKGAASYTTSGKENTYESESGLSATLKRDESITWKYMGLDEDGKALIMGSVTSSSPKMTLGGKGGFLVGGYLYGPQELNNACKALYSSIMGTARSMDINDVTRILEYTGERGAYHDLTWNYAPTTKAKTIDEIALEIGYDMNNFDNNGILEKVKDIGTYKSDAYTIDINKEEDLEVINEDRISLIYPGTASSNPTLSQAYWLSSTCVYANFYAGGVLFEIFSVGNNYVSDVLVSSGKSSRAIRPVVALNSSVQMTYDGTTVTLK